MSSGNRPGVNAPNKPRRRGYEPGAKFRPKDGVGVPGLPGPEPGRAWTPPRVVVGQTVLYQDGRYNAHQPAVPAIVNEIGAGGRALKLSIIAAENQLIRVPFEDVRHKDDPEVPRLAVIGAEEGTFGVWWEHPDLLTAQETEDVKILLEIYADEIRQVRPSADPDGDDGDDGDDEDDDAE